jgi:uncharacterized protein
MKLLVSGALIAGILVHPADAAAPGPRTKENRAVVAQAFARWAAGSGDVFSLLADDVIWTIAGTDPRVAQTYRSKQAFLAEAVRPFAARMRTPLKPSVRHVWADGDDVLVHWEGQAVTTNGVPYQNSYLWVFTMKNRKVTRVTAFLDNAAYAQVMGLPPAGGLAASPAPASGETQ